MTPTPEQPVVSTSTAVTSTGLAPNVAAGLAVLFGLIGGIIFLVIEKKDRYVRFWAMQSVVLWAAVIGVQILSAIIHVIFRGPLAILAGLVALVVWFIGVAALIIYIIMLVQAFSGKEWEIPVLGKISRQQLGRIQPL